MRACIKHHNALFPLSKGSQRAVRATGLQPTREHTYRVRGHLRTGDAGATVAGTCTAKEKAKDYTRASHYEERVPLIKSFGRGEAPFDGRISAQTRLKSRETRRCAPRSSTSSTNLSWRANGPGSRKPTRIFCAASTDDNTGQGRPSSMRGAASLRPQAQKDVGHVTGNLRHAA